MFVKLYRVSGAHHWTCQDGLLLYIPNWWVFVDQVWTALELVLWPGREVTQPAHTVVIVVVIVVYAFIVNSCD